MVKVAKIGDGEMKMERKNNKKILKNDDNFRKDVNLAEEMKI